MLTLFSSDGNLKKEITKYGKMQIQCRKTEGPFLKKEISWILCFSIFHSILSVMSTFKINI